MQGRLNSAEHALSFIKAGKALFTLRSVGSGNRYTYRAKVSDDGNVWFVSLLTGSDNENHYAYMGIIDREDDFRTTAKAKVGTDAAGYKAFEWTWRRLRNNVLPDTLEIWHEGKCGRCGRTLTVPESIERGLGPECAKLGDKNGIKTDGLELFNR